MKIEIVLIDKITNHPKNPRVGNVEAIKQSIQENGLYKPLIVSRATGHILAGNHTYKALKELEYEKVEVVYIDKLDEQSETKILLADNATSDLAEYNEQMLLDCLKSLEDLAGTGITTKEKDELKAKLETQEIKLLFEEIDELEEKRAKVKPITIKEALAKLEPYRNGDILVLPTKYKL